MNGFKLHKDGAVTTRMKLPKGKVQLGGAMANKRQPISLPVGITNAQILNRLSSLEERLEEHIRMFHIKSPSPEPKQECGCHLPIGYHTIEDHNPIPTIQPKEDTKELRDKIKRAFSDWRITHDVSICDLEDKILAIVKGEV